ncbi:PIR Superfamily Protein [Plasmodium ovale curtisi]|uniref:PIR Superfamily Protein n=1 Tax=Plasmodium ovale curtisi TaxID=864141 RepID=A0A1A8XB96_PLAOA|nr:PIR Superfamily Protein [Plasmodium ovale curtisi]
MTSLSEQELENLLKDLPSYQKYMKLSAPVDDASKFGKYCKDMQTFKNENDKMNQFCIMLERNIKELPSILKEEKQNDRCSYLNHWVYDEIRKTLRNQSNYNTDKDAVSKLINIGYSISRGVNSDCYLDIYLNEGFEKWKEYKYLNDYFGNYDRIKSDFNSDERKCIKYQKYASHIDRLYHNYKDECCDPFWGDEDCPKYFKCAPEFNPKNLLSLIKCNNITASSNIFEEVPKDPKLGEQREPQDLKASEASHLSLARRGNTDYVSTTPGDKNSLSSEDPRSVGSSKMGENQSFCINSAGEYDPTGTCSKSDIDRSGMDGLRLSGGVPISTVTREHGGDTNNYISTTEKQNVLVGNEYDIGGTLEENTGILNNRVFRIVIAASLMLGIINLYYSYLKNTSLGTWLPKKSKRKKEYENYFDEESNHELLEYDSDPIYINTYIRKFNIPYRSA